MVFSQSSYWSLIRTAWENLLRILILLCGCMMMDVGGVWMHEFVDDWLGIFVWHYYASSLYLVESMQRLCLGGSSRLLSRLLDVVVWTEVNVHMCLSAVSWGFRCSDRNGLEYIPVDSAMRRFMNQKPNLFVLWLAKRSKVAPIV